MADKDTINQPTPQQAVPAPSTVVGNDEVKLPQSKLTEILHTIEVLRKSDEENKKEIERLRYAADKNRIARYDSTEASKKSLVPKCKVSFWNGKLVLAWKMLEQEVYYGPNGVYHEKQDVQLTLQSEKDPIVVAYKDYFKQITKQEADIVSRTVDNDGNTVFTLELEDGSRVNLDSNFIN